MKIQYTLDAFIQLCKRRHRQKQTDTVHSHGCSNDKHTHTHAFETKVGETVSTAGNEAINKLMPCQIRGSLNAVAISFLLLFQKYHNSRLLRAVHCFVYAAISFSKRFVFFNLPVHFSLFYLWFFSPPLVRVLETTLHLAMVLQFFIFVMARSTFLLFCSIIFFFFKSPLFCVIPQFYGNSANYERISGGSFFFPPQIC